MRTRMGFRRKGRVFFVTIVLGKGRDQKTKKAEAKLRAEGAPKAGAAARHNMTMGM